MVPNATIHAYYKKTIRGKLPILDSMDLIENGIVFPAQVRLLVDMIFEKQPTVAEIFVGDVASSIERIHYHTRKRGYPLREMTIETEDVHKWKDEMALVNDGTVCRKLFFSPILKESDLRNAHVYADLFTNSRIERLTVQIEEGYDIPWMSRYVINNVLSDSHVLHFEYKEPGHLISASVINALVTSLKEKKPTPLKSLEIVCGHVRGDQGEWQASWERFFDELAEYDRDELDLTVPLDILFTRLNFNIPKLKTLRLPVMSETALSNTCVKMKRDGSQVEHLELYVEYDMMVTVTMSSEYSYVKHLLQLKTLKTFYTNHRMVNDIFEMYVEYRYKIILLIHENPSCLPKDLVKLVAQCLLPIRTLSN